MNHADAIAPVRKFLEERVIDSSGFTLDADVPLLEWGILNSLSTTRLVVFIKEEFDIDVPVERMVGENFRDLNSIGHLLVDLDRDARRV